MATRLVTPFLAVALGLAGVPVAGAETGVDWSRGRLSVQPGAQSLAAVLQHIQRHTGIVVKSTDPLLEPVARGFERVPLVDGLHRLLQAHNHMIIEGQGRRPLRVIVLGGPVALAPAPSPTPATAVRAGAVLLAALANPDAASRIEAIERLGDLADPAHVAALQRALTDPVEAVRAVAQQALAQARKAPAAAARAARTP